VLLAIPPLMLACASVVWTFGGLGRGGLWPALPLTLSEAAATRNTGEAARLIALGEDPNKASRVREGLLPGGKSQVVTPLEAALAIRRTDMAQMLLDYGARADPPQLRALRCYSEQFHDAGVHDFLQGLAPDPWPVCEPAAAASEPR
jgi:hypothetical protein